MVDHLILFNDGHIMQVYTTVLRINIEWELFSQYKSRIEILSSTTLQKHWPGVAFTQIRDQDLLVDHSVSWSEEDLCRFSNFIIDLQNIARNIDLEPALNRADLFTAPSFDCGDPSNNCGSGCIYCIRAILPIMRMTTLHTNHELILREMRRNHKLVAQNSEYKKYDKYHYLVSVMYIMYQSFGILIARESYDTLIHPKYLAAVGFAGVLHNSKCIETAIKNLHIIRNNLLGPMYQIDSI